MAIQTRLFSGRSRRLPLVERWAQGVDKAAPEQRQPQCTRCPLGGKGATTCMAASGAEGGLLVVGGSPGAGDDAQGEPFTTETGRYLRRLIEQHWDGPVRYAYGVSCKGGLKIALESFRACSPYLAGEFDRGAQRALIVGADAAQAVFGARLQPVDVRRAWAHVRGVPSYLVSHPQMAQRNRFVRQWLEEDVRWALKVPLPEPIGGDVHVLWEPAEAVQYLGALQRDVPVSIDIENVGSTFKKTWRLLCIGLATDDHNAYVLPEEVLRHPTVRQAFARFLADPSIPKGGQFIKYDVNGLYREFGVEIAGLDYDTGIMRRLTEADAPAKLGVLAWLVGYGGYKQLTEAQMADDEDKSEAYGKLDPDQLHAYNGRDVVVTHLARKHLLKPGRFDPFKPVWNRLVKPSILALAQVERWGALLSRPAVLEFDSWLSTRYTGLETQLRALPDTPHLFNPHSNLQVAAHLFTTLKLKSTLLTKGGKDGKGVKKPSTAKKALVAIKDKHPAVPLILEMQTVAKQRGTYGLSMLEHIGVDGRVHTTFGIVKSGRLSSKEPNLQNITGKGEEGKRARSCWVAPPGHMLVSLDYSQIELRVLADLSNDEAMIAAFERGGDFHNETASILAKLQKNMTRDDYLAALGNGTDGEKWAIDLRKGAKITNFSLVFGKGDKGLAEDLTRELGRVVTATEARDTRMAVLSAFPAMAAYQNRLIAQATVEAETWTDWNGCRRRRSLWRIAEPEGSDEAPEKDPRNVAKNHPIQGTASEYTLASLIEIVQRQQDGDMPGRLVFTVHDESISEVPEGDVERYAREARTIMLGWKTKRVPLKVDCEFGPDWGHLRKLVLD